MYAFYICLIGYIFYHACHMLHGKLGGDSGLRCRDDIPMSCRSHARTLGRDRITLFF